MPSQCTIPNCLRTPIARGLCSTHYSRLRKSGLPLLVPRPRRPIEERFWEKVDVNPWGCWLWTAAKDREGYGRFWVTDGQWALAYRWLFEQAHGPIPKGLECDHLCRTPACVRIDHIEAVTRSINIRRGVGPQLAGEQFRRYNAHLRIEGRISPGSQWMKDLQLAKTHCPQGHAYDAANTYRTKRNGRVCRSCHRVKEQARKLRLHT